MRMKIMTLILIILALGVGGYRLYEQMIKDDGPQAMSSTPVSVKIIEEKMVEDVLSYEGRVAPTVVETVSFKSSARLAAFNGEVGERLDAGDILAELDKSDLTLALEAAASQFVAATAGYEQALKGASSEDVTMASLSTSKAQEAVNYLTEFVADGTALFEEGIVSQAELDGIQLELALAEADLALAKTNYQKASGGAEPEIIKAAKAQADMAATNEMAQQSMMDDGTYVLKEQRVIVKQMFEPGELVPAGYPVAVLRSKEQMVVVGVSGDDLDQIYIGQKVHVLSDGKEQEGEVSRIAEIPDESHFLYEVEVALADEDYLIGELVDCGLVLGERSAVTIPVTAIMNDGIDYVYLAEDGKAMIRKITIVDVTEGAAIVEGLDLGDEMIVSNLNRIQEQSVIHVEE